MEQTSDSAVTVQFNLGMADIHTTIPVFMKALQQSVVQNWEILADEPAHLWSTTQKHLWPNFHRHFSTLVVERMMIELEDTEDWQDGTSFSSIEFYFSPLCFREAYVHFARKANGSLNLLLGLDGEVTREVAGTGAQRKMLGEWHDWRGATVFRSGLPESGDMPDDALRKWHDDYERLGETPSIWPKHRQCLLNIVQHLELVLSIQKLNLDPRLTDVQ